MIDEHHANMAATQNATAAERANNNEEQELLAYKQKIVNETLKNIVMHVVPTTRKAYVNDIVNGIRTLMTMDELSQVHAPVDLPENVLRFVQKRYNNLLLEESYATSSTLQQPLSPPSPSSTITTRATSSNPQVRVECDSIGELDANGVLPVKITVTMNSPLKQIVEKNATAVAAGGVEDSHLTTTELTVVKEIRKEMMPNSSEDTSALINSDEIMKVEEETLYIVEKRKQPPSDESISALGAATPPLLTSSMSQSITTTVTGNLPTATITAPTSQSTHFVEKEIRKNFELKPKEFIDSNAIAQQKLMNISNSLYVESNK